MTPPRLILSDALLTTLNAKPDVVNGNVSVTPLKEPEILSITLI
jgi:hypothetical protein